MLLEKKDILRGLQLLNDKARDACVTVDLAIYGGAALAVAFAMKCMAMRIDDPDASHDVADIKNRAKLLHIETPEAFFDIIAQFSPSAKFSPKTAFGVEEIADQLKNEQPEPPTRF